MPARGLNRSKPAKRLGSARAAALSLGLFVALSGVQLASAQCQPDFSAADHLLATHRVDQDLPGAGLAIFDAAGTDYHTAYWGSYDASTFVALASASKSVSAAAIVSLVDDGTLSLDDTVGELLPVWSGTPVGAVTVRQAFSQTAGLYNDEWPCVGDPTTTLDICATDILGNTPRISAPGKTFFYGGNSMHVAARLAEVAYCNRFPSRCAGLASGAIWRKIFDERIKGPLGIGMFWNSTTNPRIAGGLFSRLSDYRTFWRMILGGGTVDGVRVLSPAAVDLLLQDQTRSARLYYSAASAGIRYGLGIWREDPGPFGDAATLSDPGLFGFHPWFDTETGIGGLVMIYDAGGAGDGGGRHVAGQLRDAVHRLFAAGSVDSDGDGVCDAADDCDALANPGQLDSDGDGAGDACDCAPADPRLWSPPDETERAWFYPPDGCITVDYRPLTGQVICASSENLLDWLQPRAPGAIVTDLRYDVIRSGDLTEFEAGASCEASGIDRQGPFTHDVMSLDPTAGGVFGYLTRARNGCGVGPAGHAADGATIPARACP